MPARKLRQRINKESNAMSPSELIVEQAASSESKNNVEKKYVVDEGIVKITADDLATLQKGFPRLIVESVIRGMAGYLNEQDAAGKIKSWWWVMQSILKKEQDKIILDAEIWKETAAKQGSDKVRVRGDDYW
jgi:hypothetical protein